LAVRRWPGKPLWRRLAARLGWVSISADDLALAARGVTLPATHPALHAMGGIDHRDYYARYSIDELIDHSRKDHESLWGGIRKVIHAHATWAAPAVLEGWQIYPGQVVGMDLANVGSVWLDPDLETLESRIRRDVDFCRGATDKETMISHYLGRSLWHRSETIPAARELGLPVIPINGRTTIEEVEETTLKYLYRDTI
jgi:hypothetical protein